MPVIKDTRRGWSALATLDAEVGGKDAGASGPTRGSREQSAKAGAPSSSGRTCSWLATKASRSLLPS